jgi:hypothetical protein
MIIKCCHRVNYKIGKFTAISTKYINYGVGRNSEKWGQGVCVIEFSKKMGICY